MKTAVEGTSLQHAAHVAFGRAQASKPREESAARQARQPPSEWWRAS